MSWSPAQVLAHLIPVDGKPTEGIKLTLRKAIKFLMRYRASIDVRQSVTYYEHHVDSDKLSASIEEGDVSKLEKIVVLLADLHNHDVGISVCIHDGGEPDPGSIDYSIDTPDILLPLLEYLQQKDVDLETLLKREVVVVEEWRRSPPKPWHSKA